MNLGQWQLIGFVGWMTFVFGIALAVDVARRREARREGDI